MRSATRGSANGASIARSSSAGRGTICASFAASASATASACWAGTHTPGRVDAGPAAVVGNRRGDQVDVAATSRAMRSLADQDLAVARAVQLDARVALVGADGGDVAEEHAAAGAAQDLAGAGMIAG